MSATTTGNFWQGVRGAIHQRRGMPIPPRRDKDPVPLSFQQEGLWFAGRMSPGLTVHNLTMNHRLSGALDVPALNRALDEVVRRHEAMRTGLNEDGTQWIVPNMAPVSLEPMDVSESEIDKLASDLASAPMELLSPPLWRFKLLRLSENEHVFLKVFHHFIFDHWSGDIFHRDLAKLYSAYASMDESPLEPLPVQYADYAIWQRSSPVDTGFWNELFAGEIEPLELPFAGGHPGSGAGGHLSLALPTELMESVAGLAIHCGVSLFVVMLAGFKATLHAQTGQEDLIICTTVSGRTRPELRRLIGFFNNILPLRTRIMKRHSAIDVIGAVGRSILQTQPHQEVPFQKIAAVPASEGVSLKRALFTMQNTPGRPAGMEGLAMRRMDVERAGSDFDLSLAIRKNEGQWIIHARFNGRLYSRENVARLLDCYVEALHRFVDRPASSLGRISRAARIWSRLRGLR
jgi:hypothetical protein